jgi:hypothetical protein
VENHAERCTADGLDSTVGHGSKSRTPLPAPLARERFAQ